jgi:hypothetical protein
MKAAVKDKPMKTGVADTPKKLAAKYTDEVVKAVRERFDQDYENWQDIQSEGKLDVQCRSTIRGPWPEEEWRSRHTKGNERPCLHEDVLSQFCNEIINEAEMNPMGVSITPQSEDSSEQTALFRENRIRQIEYEQNGSDSYLTAIKNAVQRSYGFWFLETYYEGNFKDPDNQRMAIEAAMDPDSVIPGFAKKPDWSDMRDCWVKEKMTHQEFRNRWPKAKITDFRGLRTEGMEHWFDDKTVTVAAWWHLEEDERYLLTINDGDGELDVYEDELDEGAPIDEEKISKRRTEVKRVILKTIFNGVEALDETQWIDEGDDINQPEIPVMVVTGRVEYEEGKRKLESLVRKGRTGQLLYDFVISAIQERLAMVPKAKFKGPEGSFDTDTDWRTINRSPVMFVEYKLQTYPDGSAAPPPDLIDIAANTGDLEAAKQSILVGIQNAIGMSSTERMDRVAKSGKALGELGETQTVVQSHYKNSLRKQQERQYRIMDRILETIDGKKKAVAVRNPAGKTTLEPTSPDLFKGTHSVVIESGKLYQSQQEEQSDVAESLLKINDPQILLAVLPDVIRMKGIGKLGDELARMIESIQPPQMQAARNGQAPADPAAQQAMTKATQHIQQLQAQIQQNEMDKKAETVKMTAQQKMNEDDNRTKIAIAAINASVKESMETLDAQVGHIKDVADVILSQVQMAHEATQNDLDRQAAAQQATQEQAAASQQQASDQAQQQQQNQSGPTGE